MAEANQPSLGDFFKAKAKKKIKASNLNKDNTTSKTEETKSKTKTTEDDAWQEEQVVASTMKVEVAGKLVREEETTVEDTAGPAWGNVKQGSVKQDPSVVGQSKIGAESEKKFPTLAKSVASSSINIDDGADAKVNIATSKNHFAALEGGDDEDEDAATKRPKEIKPAMVSKKQGEREKVALQREVDKYTSKKDAKKKTKQPAEEEDEEEEDDDDEDDAEEADEPAPVVKEEVRKKNKPQKKGDQEVQAKKEEQAEEERLEEDLQIAIDLDAAKAKYEGRRKLPPKSLPREELEERREKETKPKAQAASGGKKKKFVMEEETNKLQYMPEDW